MESGDYEWYEDRCIHAPSGTIKNMKDTYGTNLKMV